MTVTATLADGLAWGTLPAGWIEVNPTTATFAVSWSAASCEEVTPVGPTVTRRVCRGGVLAPTLDVGADRRDHLQRRCRSPYPPLQTVVVTATLDDAEDVWPDVAGGVDRTGRRRRRRGRSSSPMGRVIRCRRRMPTVVQATCRRCGGGAVGDGGGRSGGGRLHMAPTGPLMARGRWR